MSDCEYSEACKMLVIEIQTRQVYPESYALMLQTFFDSKQDGETNRMAVSLAKKSICQQAGGCDE